MRLLSDIWTWWYNGDVYIYVDRSLLFLAVIGGHIGTATMLIESGADVNKGFDSKHDSWFGDMFFGTPLIEACFQGHEDIVKLLIKNKADLEAQSSTYVLRSSQDTRRTPSPQDTKGTAIQFAKGKSLIEAKEEGKKNYRSIIGLLIAAGAQDLPEVDTKQDKIWSQ